MANLAEAEKRGFTPGRRERTQLGDTLRFRADRAVEQAVRAPIDDRRRLLGQASADYEACAGKFDGLTGYHDAEKVLAYCQGRRTVLQRLWKIGGRRQAIYGRFDVPLSQRLAAIRERISKERRQ